MRAEQVAAFVEHRLAGAELLGVEEHLAECRECRAEVVDVERLVTGARRRRVGTMATGGIGIAAAAILAVSLVRHSRSPGTDAVLRGDQPAPLVAVWPSGSVPRSDLRFVWHSAGSGAVYRITVADSAGNTVWTTDKQDTTVTAPATLALAPGAEYHWTVDARLSEGTSRTTEPQSFRIAR